MSEDGKDKPFAKQPFLAILGEPDWTDMESRRVKCLGLFVSAGGGGIIMMVRDWETINHRAIPWEVKSGFLSDVLTARAQLFELTVDVSREDALWIAALCQHSRVYWPGDESEIVL
jgi:hypothetical protein